MTYITLSWHDIESAGYTDLLPADWFASLGRFPARIHKVRGPRGGMYKAKCDLLVERDTALFDYEPYGDFNGREGMLLGQQKFKFRDERRKAVAQVFWRKKGDGKFVPFSTTITVEEERGGSISEDVDLMDEEGRTYLVAHLARERSSKLVKAKKAAVLKDTGTLACEVCGFVFSSKYGAIGDGFCEVHHRASLASGGERRIYLDDLAVLCSNCHRMIHRTGNPLLSVDAFRESLSNPE